MATCALARRPFVSMVRPNSLHTYFVTVGQFEQTQNVSASGLDVCATPFTIVMAAELRGTSRTRRPLAEF
jgi:hypothetical protein